MPSYALRAYKEFQNFYENCYAASYTRTLDGCSIGQAVLLDRLY